MSKDWNKFAGLYNKIFKLEEEYTKNQLKCLDISPSDTILDVGCGPGRISVFLAKIAKSVTALDAFDEMLKLCNENASNAGINNITTVLMDWKDADIGNNVQIHDIVIASRSVGMTDPIKLNAAAKKYAVMIGWAPVMLPSIFSLFEGVADDTTMQFSDSNDGIRQYISGYKLPFNEVYDMGALPNVQIVQDGFSCNYPSRRKAYDDLAQIQEFSSEKQQIFENNVDKFLAEESDGSVTYHCERLSYVLWWKTIH